MKKWGVLVLVLLASASAYAGDETVSVLLRSGERVDGKLVGLTERRWRVKVGSNVIEIAESDVKRIDFVETAKTAAASETPAPAGEKTFDPEALVPPESELPKGLSAKKTRTFGRAALDGWARGASKDDPVKGGNLEQTFFRAEEVTAFTWSERASLELVVFRYPSSADAARFVPFVRKQLRAEGLEKLVDGHVVETIRVGNLFLVLSDTGVTRLTVNAFRAAIAKRLDALSVTPDIEVTPASRALRIELLDVPEALMPVGLSWSGLQDDDVAKIGPSRAPPIRTSP